MGTLLRPSGLVSKSCLGARWAARGYYVQSLVHMLANSIRHRPGHHNNPQVLRSVHLNTLRYLYDIRSPLELAIIATLPFCSRPDQTSPNMVSD